MSKAKTSAGNSDYPELALAIQNRLMSYVKEWESIVRSKLPALPPKLHIQWLADAPILQNEEGVTGWAYDAQTISLVYKATKINKRLLGLLHDTYFHEVYHLVQGFTYAVDWRKWTPLGSAIYEGAATAFERANAESAPFWCRYPKKTIVTEWLNEMRQLPKEYDWQAWRIYHPEKKEHNIAYKVGLYIVDEALRKSSLEIEDIATFSWESILELSGR